MAMNKNFAAVADLVTGLENEEKHQEAERKELNQFIDSQYQILEDLPSDPEWKATLQAVKPLLDVFRSVNLVSAIHRPYLYAYDPEFTKVRGHNALRDGACTVVPYQDERFAHETEMTPACAYWKDDKKARFPLKAQHFLLDVLRVDPGNPRHVSAALSHYAVKEKEAPYIKGDVNFVLYEPSWPRAVTTSHMHGCYFESPDVQYFHVALGCNSISETEASANGAIASKTALSGGEYFKSGLRADRNCPLHYAFNQWGGFTQGLASAALAIVAPERRGDLLQGLRELGSQKSDPAPKL
jgi:hypothetical protein